MSDDSYKCPKCGGRFDDQDQCPKCDGTSELPAPSGSATTRVRYHCTSCQRLSDDPDVCEHCGEHRGGVVVDFRTNMEQFKHNIGDIVTPVVMDNYEHATKMVVTARVTEEYAQHTERYYIVSHYKLGDYVRQRIAESEIIAWEQRLQRRA